MRMNPFRSAQPFCLSPLLCLALVAVTAPAVADDGPWTLRAVVGQGLFASPSVVPSGEDRVTLGAEDEAIFGLEAEYRMNRRFGVEVGILDSRPTYTLSVDFTDSSQIVLTDDSTFRPVTAGLSIHLTPDRSVDVSLTPLVGYADYGNQRYEFEGESATLNVGSDFVWGGRLALDVPIGESSWALSFGARYLSTSIEGDDPDGERVDVDVDPFFLTAGIGYRF